MEKLTLYLKPEYLQAIQRLAEFNDMSVSAYCRNMLEKHIDPEQVNHYINDEMVHFHFAYDSDHRGYRVFNFKLPKSLLIDAIVRHPNSVIPKIKYIRDNAFRRLELLEAAGAIYIYTNNIPEGSAFIKLGGD